jgi:hypothetical protein|tara:strand:+ start:3521 stop:4018 length:498 start_codon:yes stop_codon:yes gene_type:complete
MLELARKAAAGGKEALDDFVLRASSDFLDNYSSHQDAAKGYVAKANERNRKKRSGSNSSARKTNSPSSSTAKKTASAVKRAGVSGVNKPKRTPNHPKKSHIVVAKEGSKIKTIRFGEQGASTAGKPKKGESERMKKKRASFKARHRKNIAKGKMSAAYWADKVKW